MIEELESKLRAWVERELGKSVVTLALIPGGASRRSYKVTLSDDSAVFLRVDTGEGPLSGTEMNLAREKQFLDPVHQRHLPAPEIIAYDETLNALLMQHVDGFTSYQKTLGAEAQRDVERSLMNAVARLHALDIIELDLPDAGNRRTVGDAISAALIMWRGLYDDKVSLKDPVISFALHWLATNIPDKERVAVLVHGDVGPGNFLFSEKGEVNALIDWELAHIGHPLEDMACVLCRALGVEFGSAPQLIADYEAASGIEVARSTLDYAVILVLTEWCVGINLALSRPTTNQDVAMLFLWGHVNRFALLEKLATFFDRSLPKVDAPEKLAMEWSFIPDYIENSLAETILPAANDAFITHRLNALIQLQKVQRCLLAYGPESYCQEEMKWAKKLTGNEFPDYATAHNALIERSAHAAAESDVQHLDYLLWRTARERTILHSALGAMADRRVEY